MIKEIKFKPLEDQPKVKVEIKPTHVQIKC